MKRTIAEMRELAAMTPAMWMASRNAYAARDGVIDLCNEVERLQRHDTTVNRDTLGYVLDMTQWERGLRLDNLARSLRDAGLAAAGAFRGYRLAATEIRVAVDYDLRDAWGPDDGTVKRISDVPEACDRLWKANNRAYALCTKIMRDE